MRHQHPAGGAELINRSERDQMQRLDNDPAGRGEFVMRPKLPTPSSSATA
jgi:hypothetical protein